MRHLAIVTAVLAIACSDEGPDRVSLNAHVVKGAAPGASPVIVGLSQAAIANAAAPGFWAISPDQARIEIVKISFFDASGGADGDTLTNCLVTYTRAASALTSLLDCPFSIHPGTYIGASVGIKNSYDVLIDDQVNGIYTDPASTTKLSATRPVGGPQFVNYSVTLSSGQHGVVTNSVFFKTPVTVDSGATMPTLSVVADLIHSVFITVTASSMSFYTELPIAPVYLTPLLDGVAKVEFYTSTATALNVRTSNVGDNDVNSVRVVYSGTQPATIISPIVGPSSATAVDPAKSPVQSNNGWRAGGYLGLDASGMMCWALPVDWDYKAYNALRRMQPASALGQATVLQTMTLNGGQAPKPTSGDTYASGCPSSFTPNSAVTVYLVAK